MTLWRLILDDVLCLVGVHDRHCHWDDGDWRWTCRRCEKSNLIYEAAPVERTADQ